MHIYTSILSAAIHERKLSWYESDKSTTVPNRQGEKLLLLCTHTH